MLELGTNDPLPTARSVGGLSKRWRLYQQLVAGIPDDVLVKHVCVGSHWIYVEAESGLGLSMLVRGGLIGNRLTCARGMRLQDLAALCTSWRFLEASIGVAALNAWYSSEPVARANGMVYEAKGENDGFEVYKRLVPGKKVTVVGHFPLVERLADVCELTVLERDPHGSDMPDPACEYIVPEQDFLFITGITLTNKTLPRLLELARMGGAQVIMVGPSVVPSPIFFDYGVSSLAGCVCLPERVEDVKEAIELGALTSLFKLGAQKMRVERPGWADRNFSKKELDATRS